MSTVCETAVFTHKTDHRLILSYARARLATLRDHLNQLRTDTRCRAELRTCP